MSLLNVNEEIEEFCRVPLSTESDTKDEPQELVHRLDPPDRGWAWMVLFGVSIITMLLPLVAAFFGMLFEHLVDLYHMSSVTVAWIFNIHLCSWHFGGLLGGSLCKEFGYRQVAFWSSLGATVSMTVCSFVNLFAFLYINAIIFGVCSGLAYCAGTLLLPHYFVHRLGFAMSIVTSATAFGQFVLPLYINFLQEHFGAIWAVRMFAVTIGHCIVASMVLHPVEWHNKRRKTYVVDNRRHLTGSSALKIIFTNVGQSLIKSFTSLRNVDIGIVSICGAMYLICYMNFMMMLPFSIVNKGYSMETAAYCISMGGIVNIVARILIGPLTDMLKVKKTPIFIVGHFLLATSIIAFVYASTTVGMVVALGVNGFATGTSISLHILVLIETGGVENVGQMYGSFSFLTMVLFVTVGPLVGFLRDTFVSYTISNITLAGLVYFDVILLLVLRIKNNRDTA